MREIIRQYVSENLGIDDDETIQMLIDAYVDALNQNMERLNSAISAADMGETRQGAHALKGCSANIGLEELRQCAYALEQAGAAGDVAAAKAAFSELQQKSACFMQSIQG